MKTDRQISDRALKDLSFGAPHLWILGAGASVHAFPHGDRAGRRLPLMNDLVELVGLEGLLSRNGVDFNSRDFEDIYDELLGDGKFAELQREIEDRIAEYFAELQLPDEPCLYDYLVWSLRSKDVIATFNWDPFLWQACVRAASYFDPPTPVFLHGKVAVGYCLADRVKGPTGETCDRCGQAYRRSRLLYPVSKKNYSSDSRIAGEWDGIRAALKAAFLVTVFGYSAPQTDAEAVALLRAGWGKPAERQFEQISIIDIRPQRELLESWKFLIHGSHFGVHDDFYSSWLIRHPRRSCEALFAAVMQNSPYPDDPLPRLTSFEELHDFFEPYLSAEAVA